MHRFVCQRVPNTALVKRKARPPSAGKTKGAKKKNLDCRGKNEAGFRGFVWGYRRPDGPRGRAETRSSRATGRGEGSFRRPDSCQIKNDGEIARIRENNYRIGSSVLASLKNSLLVSSTA